MTNSTALTTELPMLFLSDIGLDNLVPGEDFLIVESDLRHEQFFEVLRELKIRGFHGSGSRYEYDGTYRFTLEFKATMTVVRF